MSLREAVREALEGRQKQTALDLWPDRRDAEAELSKVLAGERRPPWELLELVLQVPSRAPVLRLVERLAHVECKPLARPMVEHVEELVGMARSFARSAEAIEQVAQAILSESERGPFAPKKVEPSATRSRRTG